MNNDDLDMILMIFEANPTAREAVKRQFLASTARSRTDQQHAANCAAKYFARDIAIKTWAESPDETINGLAQYIQLILVESHHKEYATDTIKGLPCPS